MKKNFIIQLLCISVCWLVSNLPLSAQFSGGAEALNESRVIHRAWHITNLRGSNFIVKVSGSSVVATDNGTNDASTFILEPGEKDADWATSDSRWFHIRNLSTGQYITVATSGSFPRSVSLTEYDDESHAQQFRLIATGIASQYKLRSRLSSGGSDLVLEATNSGVVQADSPKADPSAEQKFTFNLAKPGGSSRRFILGSPGGRFMSDNGIKIEGTQVVQNEDVDESAIWELEHVEASYYRIRNNLTKLFLTAPSGSTTGDIPVMATSPQGARSEWELDPTDAFFRLKSREFPNLFVSATDQQSGQPVRLRTSADGFRRWLISIVEGEIVIAAGNFQRIETGTLPSECFATYGPLFKKALCERVGLDPAQSELYFDFIREAIASKVGQNRVDEILQKFDLNNTGHRADLALMVRFYITEVLPYVSFAQWSPATQAAVIEIENKILTMRIDYGDRLLAAWDAYVIEQGQNLTLADIYFYWLDSDGFQWPIYYDASEEEAYAINDYVSAAAAFGEYNNGIVGFTAIGASVVTLSIVAAKLPFALLYVAYWSNTPLSFSAIAGGTTVGSYAVMAGGPVIAVAVFAASFIAMQATEVAELQQFENSIAEDWLWTRQPINLMGTLGGNHLLARIKVLNDLDIVLGATPQGAFQHNTNDNFYFPSFTLNCAANITLDMDATGDATLTVDQVLGIVPTPICGSALVYSLSENHFDCNDLPSAEVTLTAQNDKSIQSCTVTINLRDNTPPTVTCPGAQTLVLDANCSAILPDYRYLATHLTDNCDVDVVTQSPPGGTTITGAGDMTVTFTVLDVSGNSTECTFTVTKVDNILPTVLCPTTQILELATDCTAAIPDYRSLATIGDNCGISSVVQVAPPGSMVSGAGSINAALIVTDLSNNVVQCGFTITKVDNTPPTVLCPSTQTLVLATDCTAALPDYRSLATIADNCGISSVVQVAPPGYIVSGAGSINAALIVTDINNNIAQCGFTITKVDNTPPTVQCFPQTLTFNGETQFVLNADDLVDASDNCGVASIILSPSVITCAQIGQTVTVTATVADINGNTSTCTSQITVTGLPCGWIQNPDGVNCTNGSSNAYNPVNGVWTTTSTNCYSANFGSDAAAFAQRTLCGDGSITAQVTGISGASGWAGIVMRETNDAGAKKAQLITNLSSLNRQEFRTTTGGQAMPQQFASQNRFWLRIVRAGNQFSMYASPNGQNWFFAGAQNIAMGACIQVGLVATNATPNSTLTATFANMSITGGNSSLVTAPEGLVQTASVPADFSVYPNPTESAVTLNFSGIPDHHITTLMVFSALGEQVLSRQTKIRDEGTMQLDLSELADGIYFIRVEVAGQQPLTRRIVLTKASGLRP